MIIVLKQGTTQQEIDTVTNAVVARGVSVSPIVGTVTKNVPWHILAPSAVACDMFLLRASAHHWHVSAFLCNREFQGISCYTKKGPPPPSGAAILSLSYRSS